MGIILTITIVFGAWTVAHSETIYQDAKQQLENLKKQ